MIYSMRFLSNSTPPPFDDPRLAEHIIGIVKQFHRNDRMTMYAYCLMPDHLHIVATPPVGSSIAKLMQDFKIETCSAAHDEACFGDLWDKIYYLPIKDDVRALKDICRFVESNPVRNGLVNQLQEWNHVWVSRLIAGR